MMRIPSLAAAAILSLALSACGSSGTEADAPAEAEATGAAAPSPSAAPSASPPAGGLAAYVGKYPTDEVDGVSWGENPLVLAAVRRTVTDAAALEAILGGTGPAAPIELVDGKVAAWACEQHNCGAHQWTVLAEPSGASAEVCYFDEEADPAASRWFMPGGTTETRPGNCQLGEG